MSLTQQQIRRLALIKRLFQRGVEQAQAPEPLGAFAVLDFHDAAEWFLVLIADHVEADLPSYVSFPDYWEKIREKSEVSVSHKNEMGRLNKARVELKHRGILPAHQQVLEFQASTRAFFEEDCDTILGVSFEGVSLASLVPWEDAREHLEASAEASSEGDLQRANTEVAIAMQIVLRRAALDHEDFRSNFSPFGYRSGPRWSEVRKLPEPLHKYALKLEEELAEVRARLRLLSLGLEVQAYDRFYALTPGVFRRGGEGEYEVRDATLRDDVDQQDVEYCRNFVVETALTLAEKGETDVEYRRGPLWRR